MIGRADRLEQLVAAILDQDRPVVVPGALGMGKTTLALAAAYDARVVARFCERRRIFVNLAPVADADGLLRRLAADLGVDAAGPPAQVEAKIAAACAAGPALAILDNLETPWRKHMGVDGGAARAACGDRGPAAHYHRSRRNAASLRAPALFTLPNIPATRRSRRACPLPSARGRSLRNRPCPAQPPARARRPSSIDRAVGR